MLTSNKAVYGTDGSLSELGKLKTSENGGLVMITDLIQGEDYIIDDTNISAFIVSQFVTHNDDIFIMPATYIDTSKITNDHTLYCQFMFSSLEGAPVEMSVGCSFTRRNDGKVKIYMSDIGIDDISIGYFKK